MKMVVMPPKSITSPFRFVSSVFTLLLHLPAVQVVLLQKLALLEAERHMIPTWPGPASSKTHGDFSLADLFRLKFELLSRDYVDKSSTSFVNFTVL